LITALDRYLLSAPKWAQRLGVAVTVCVMAGFALPNVPRQYLDYSDLPILRHIPQFETYGTDTISEMYVAKVVLNDPSDMYTKARLEQTPLEAATWSKEASGPYPPLTLLVEAALYKIGEVTGIGFYGMILILAAAFVGFSARYFLATRWYLFPALYLNFAYFGHRFVYVQDCTYLVMLVTVLGALFAARHGKEVRHALMAAAITMKISPFYYAANLPAMKRRTAVLFVSILVAGLVLPIFIWDNYLYIFRYNDELKGDWKTLAGGLAVALPFAWVLRYVERRRNLDAEARIGWGLVPVAMLLAFKMNAARHLMIVLLVPDKSGARNLAAAAGLGIHALMPGLVRFNSLLPIVTVFLIGILVWHLKQIGWDVVRRDLRRGLVAP
jgi:hypothetical protein